MLLSSSLRCALLRFATSRGVVGSSLGGTDGAGAKDVPLHRTIG
jgi:hypothetical protein